MRKILVFGNSGAGKSTLSKKISEYNNLPHLDLDILAWLPTSPPTRKPIDESQNEITQFISNKSGWIIEGGYADLLQLLTEEANEIIFLNPGGSQCVENARSRPWEPHKYKTKEEQDSNLEMLIEWIQQYYIRKDEFSLTAHTAFYDSFQGNKSIYEANFDLNEFNSL